MIGAGIGITPLVSMLEAIVHAGRRREVYALFGFRNRREHPFNNYQFYVCGPGALMESLVPALLDWGVPESHVHFEAFGPASVKTSRKLPQQPAAVCEVQFDRSRRAAKWDGSLASLLEFGEATGVVMNSGCRAGSCGECLMAIRSGTVATIKPPGFPVPPGHCLACVSVPTSDLVLEA
jgi:ferredoxin